MPSSCTFTAPGSHPNEDLLRVHATGAWVLDGTSGWKGRSFTSAESGGAWYVAKFDEYLANNIHDFSRSLTQIVRDAICHLTSELVRIFDEANNSLNDAIHRSSLPSACVTIIRWNESTGTVEYFTLGDTVIVAKHGENVERICEASRLDEIDANTRQVFHDIVTDADSITDDVIDRANTRREDHIADTRALLNTPDGYWIAQTNPYAAQMGETGEFSMDSLSRIMLFSDGFDPVVEQYGVFTDWGAVWDYIDNHSISDAVDQLHTAEENDVVLQHKDRPHDDVAVVDIDFST